MLKESIKLKIRKIIFLSLTIVAYFFTVIYLFGLHDLLWSIVCIFFTFISFHFLFLDIKNMNIWKFILVLLWLFLITILLFWICKWEINFFIILWALWLNVAIWALFYSLWMISFNSIWYFMRWWYIFSLIITTMYSISLIWMFQQFPFTCDGLNEASNKLFEFVEKPFLLTFNKKHINDEKIDLQQNNEISISNEESITWTNQFENVINNEIELEGVEEPEISWNEKKSNVVISKIAEIKSSTIDQVLDEQESYSSEMCELLLDWINSKFWLENFKRSVILLIYLLLYWFIRISFWVMSWIAFIIFKILYRCRVYRISETTKKVDEIY